MIILTAILVTACIVLFHLCTKTKNTAMAQLANKIPGIEPRLFSDGLKSKYRAKEIYGNIARLSQKYGSVVKLWRGRELFIYILDAKHIQMLLCDMKQVDKTTAYKFLEPLMGEGLITSTGEKYRRHRKIITPSFHTGVLREYVSVFDSNVDVLLEQLGKRCDGPGFDVLPVFTWLSIDVFCETSMKVKVNAQTGKDAGYANAVRRAFDLLIARAKASWRVPDFLYKLSSEGSSLSKCLTTVHSRAEGIIDNRRQQINAHQSGEEQKMSFLDTLLTGALTNQEIRDEVYTMLIAGGDTTSVALSFICWLLGKHQHVQDKLVTELSDILGDSDRPVTFEDLGKMKYLELVIKETLRLYPSAPVIGRKIDKDCNFGDYILPAGANVVVPLYLLHRSEKYFPRPEIFDPDRFLPENVKERHPFCFLPFGAGSRSCMGQRYAMHMMKTTICKLVRRYRITAGSTAPRLIHHVTLASTTGFHIKLEPRHPCLSTDLSSQDTLHVNLPHSFCEI